jgi:hypothetical protein
MSKSLLILISVSLVGVTPSLWAQSGSPVPVSKQVEESDQSLDAEKSLEGVRSLETEQALDASVSDATTANAQENTQVRAEVNTSTVVNETKGTQENPVEAGQASSKGTFKPSEEIVEDQAVSFPLDI